MSDFNSLSQAFMIWKNAELTFMSMLIQRLKADLTDFNSEALVTQMQILQENWPVNDPDEDVAGQARVGLAFWREITEATELAISSAD